MIPVLEPRVIRAAEAPAIAGAADEGDPDRLMRSAARAVSDAVLDLVDSPEVHAEGTDIVVLVGGGNNGGDALYAASMLAEQGMTVVALRCGSSLHAGGAEAARAAGVGILAVDAEHISRDPAVRAALDARIWIDGILGTGLSGPLRPETAALIEALVEHARLTRPRIVAIDVPSGAIDADGAVAGPILSAETTIAMGAVSTSIGLPPAAYAVGTVRVHDTGIDVPDADIHLFTDADAREVLYVPGPTDHKYTRGAVGIAAGSETYPGAGVLAVLGAQAGGPGLIRLDAPERVEALVLAAAPGIVTAGGRIQAGLTGPGMDDDSRPHGRDLAAFCSANALPLVLDAGALSFVVDSDLDLGDWAILTPHAGEAAALLTECGEPTSRAEVEARPVVAARRLAAATRAIVLLKGASTLIGVPDGEVIVIERGSAWTGVAGAGDALAGLTAGLSASWRARVENGEKPTPLARVVAAAAHIHAAAGRTAALALGTRGGPISARDIVEAIPAVIGELLSPETIR